MEHLDKVNNVEILKINQRTNSSSSFCDNGNPVGFVDLYMEPNDGQSINGSVSTKSNKILVRKMKRSFGEWLSSCKVPKMFFNVVMFFLLPLLVWLVTIVIFHSQSLPGGSIFVIVFLEFGGRLLGYLVSLVHLPPNVGMLGLGIIIRNVPYVDFAKYLSPTAFAPIRQISLAIILVRAGLGLNFEKLLKYKWLVARLAIFPTIMEALATCLVVRLLLRLPWLWCLLVGFVVAAVLPAVILPRVLALKESGYGIEKGIPTVVIAAASVDNVIAIVMFGVVLELTFANRSLTKTLLQGPLDILLGFTSGFLWGIFSGMIFPPNCEKGYRNTGLKIFLLIGGGISSVLGFRLLKFPGAGGLSCLLSTSLAAQLWRKRQVALHDFEFIKWVLTFLWEIMEPLLFGVIGCQIVISNLETDIVLLGVGCLAVGAMVRFITTFLMVSHSGFNTREKIFFAICWVPKATVQAAIGPMALELAQKSGNKDFEKLGLQVLTLAVLVIILTAPIGELGVILSGRKFLHKSPTAKKSSKVIHL